jgi:hypothetical protein
VTENIEMCKDSFQLMTLNKEMLQSKAIQTLEYYRTREYKGLDFCERKDVGKIRKGKFGTATSYTPISNDQEK